MIREGFVKSNLARKRRIAEITIDAPWAWCKSQMIRIYSVLVRLNNGRHA
jgi:hypothetical protein